MTTIVKAIIENMGKAIEECESLKDQMTKVREVLKDHETDDAYKLLDYFDHMQGIYKTKRRLGLYVDAVWSDYIGMFPDEAKEDEK